MFARHIIYKILSLTLCLKSTLGDSVKCDINVDISDGFKSGGTITKDGVTYNDNDYFLDGNTFRGCVCNVKKCLRRCCRTNETLLIKQDYSPTCSSSFPEVNMEEDLQGFVNNIHQFHIVAVPERKIECVGEDEYKILLNSDIEIDEFGNLVWDKTQYYSYDKYCASNIDNMLTVIICLHPDPPINRILYCLGMIISMPFLFATFLIYLILPERHTHQNALMFYVLTLFTAYLLLVIINLTPELANVSCSLLAYLALFCFMASFFWMNVICFDIWYTFSGGRGYMGTRRRSETRRFFMYSGYAWGIPIIYILMIFTMEKVLPEDSEHKPNIGIRKCFLEDGWPNLWYFYGEAGILVLANVIFFCLTAFKILQVKKETSMLEKNDSKRHTYEKDKQRFNLYMKLLLAMGINWSMEVISWLVNWQTDYKYKQVWYLTDFVNAVYGVVIFFIFVFKKKIWKILQKRYYNFIGKPHLGRALTTTTDTRTSHYSSENYSATDTNITDRTGINERSTLNSRARVGETALRQ